MGGSRGEEADEGVVLERDEPEIDHLVRGAADAARGTRAVGRKVLRSKLTKVVAAEARHASVGEKEARVLTTRRHRGNIVVHTADSDVSQAGEVPEGRALGNGAPDAQPGMQKAKANKQ